MTEQEQIKEAFEDLLKSLRKETSKENRQKIKEAFEFANEAHKGVKRRSGEPYILHPLAVAKIAVKEIGLGTTSVISALLHDVVEDTDYTVEDIANLFGSKVASIVDGLTKISGVMGSDTSRQAESFRKRSVWGRLLSSLLCCMMWWKIPIIQLKISLIYSGRKWLL